MIISLLRVYISLSLDLMFCTYQKVSLIHPHYLILATWKYLYLGNTLVTANHPSNSKIGGICVRTLPLKVLHIHSLQKCVNFDLRFGDKLCNFTSLFWSLSRSQDVFERFTNNFELNTDSFVVNNPFLVVVLGDFKSQTKTWYK